MRYTDRRDAGVHLAGLLGAYAGRPDVVVLGIPRGGVPVAAEVARSLGAPMDVFIVRKLGLPGHRELAMGAIASGGIRVINPAVASYGSRDAIDAIVAERRARILAPVNSGWPRSPEGRNVHPSKRMSPVSVPSHR